MRKQIAVVTGAGSGMGRETALILSDRFSKLAELWVTGRNTEALEALRHDAACAVRIFPGDLSDGEPADAIGAALKEERPAVRFLVNAAGYGKVGDTGTFPKEESVGMVTLNCAALTYLTETVLPYMPDNSRIINFASSAAFLPQPGFNVYAASKAYVLNYSRALNRELKARRIAVTAVCPGPVDTAFFTRAETYKEAPSWKRAFMASPERVAMRAVADSVHGKAVSVYGLPMQAFRAASKLIPTELLLTAEEKGLSFLKAIQEKKNEPE